MAALDRLDIAAGWKATRADLLRDIAYRAYDSATETHATAPGEACVGVRGPKRVATDGNGVTTTRATWTVTDTAARPVLRSLIVDGAETWVVETATPDPAAEAVHLCDCYLGDP